MKRSNDVDEEFEKAESETQQRNLKSQNLPLLGHVFISYADMTKIACDALIAINIVTHYTQKYPAEIVCFLLLNCNLFVPNRFSSH
jgi:hypothetical protein